MRKIDPTIDPKFVCYLVPDHSFLKMPRKRRSAHRTDHRLSPIVRLNRSAKLECQTPSKAISAQLGIEISQVDVKLIVPSRLSGEGPVMVERIIEVVSVVGIDEPAPRDGELVLFFCRGPVSISTCT